MTTTDAQLKRSPDKEARTGLHAAIFLLGVLFYLYYGVYKIYFSGFDILGGDLVRGCLVARNYLSGLPLYLLPPGWNGYPYFPPVTLIFVPFSVFGDTTAVTLWFLLGQVLVAAVFWTVYRYGRRNGRLLSAAAAAAAVLFSMPLCSTLQTGNINILIFFGLVLVYSGLLSGRTGFVPAALAVFTAIKIFPAILAGLFIRRRQYRAFGTFVLCLAGLAVLSLVVFGVDSNSAYLRQLPAFTRFAGLIQAMSLTFFIKLFWPEAPMPFLIAASGAFLIALAALWWGAAAKAPGGERTPGAGVADLFALTAIMVLVYPSSWIMYGAFYAVPFYFVAFSWLDGRSDFKRGWVFGLAFFLTCFWEIIYYQLPLSAGGLTLQKVWVTKELHPVLYRCGFSVMFLANLALFGWILSNYRELEKAVERVRPDGGPAFSRREPA